MTTAFIRADAPAQLQVTPARFGVWQEGAPVCCLSVSHLHVGAQTIGSSAPRPPLCICIRNCNCSRNLQRVSRRAQGAHLTTASHESSAPASVPPAQTPPLPARWSITNRIFNFSLPATPRANAARLWNPINSSPRTLAVYSPPRTGTRDSEAPNVPIDRPQTAGTRDEYPLLQLPRRSPAPSSLFVERSTGGDTASGRTSIGLPRDRRSGLHPDQPHSPGPMAVEHDAAANEDRHDAPVPEPRTDDPEAGATIRRHSFTRVSLPSRPGSLRSHAASRQGNEQEDGDDASEYQWGPSHPCFPHPNPHVPLNSDMYDNTRIIRIKRDWMLKGDLAPTFANLYPEILDPIISEDEFRKIVQRINDTLVEAFNPFSFRAWLDTIMGVVTFWLWDDAGLTQVKKKLSELEKWIDSWNRHTGVHEGVSIIPLRRTGYLTLDIQIPDPHLGPDNGTSTRPTTNEDEGLNSNMQRPGEYDNYPITPAVQVDPSSPLAVETRS
ncbi:hypothetical protein CC80DRAFT_534787 [Byssothecium circinans]|uniref:Ras modification protein ERF4 n=1 Tax=Byssothecium circinans TaxID=147558 RepID=A0A6A5U132_9PLEO|nr:hypothetical protein CC80DRAFT_534787 [Byssothecium circinans]